MRSHSYNYWDFAVQPLFGDLSLTLANGRQSECSRASKIFCLVNLVCQNWSTHKANQGPRIPQCFAFNLIAKHRYDELIVRFNSVYLIPDKCIRSGSLWPTSILITKTSFVSLSAFETRLKFSILFRVFSFILWTVYPFCDFHHTNNILELVSRSVLTFHSYQMYHFPKVHFS